MTDVPTFKTYEEAAEWVEIQKANYGKRAYTATPEYAAAYPQIKKLTDEKFGEIRKANRAARKNRKHDAGGPANLLAFCMR